MSQSNGETEAVIASDIEKKKEFKIPSDVAEPLHVNGTDIKENAGSLDITKSSLGTKSRPKTPLEKTNDSPNHSHNTRSRSKTPQNVTPPPPQEELVDFAETVDDQIDSENEINLSITIDDGVVLDKDDNDIIPELQFDENDVDIEPDGSPNRCRTRRSQLTTVLTPKTPKLLEDDDIAAILLEQDVSDSQSTTSLDNVSTTAVADSDTRNIDLTQESLPLDENAYSMPDCSLPLKDTLRNISPRRTIRSVNSSNYRKFAITNSTKNNASTSIPDYDPVQRVAGVKRKSSSVQLNDPKKFKESPGFFNYIISPIRSLKDKFTTRNLKCVDYEEEATDKSEVFVKKLTVNCEENSQRQWCSIM